MPLIAQICMVVVTLALLAMAVMAIGLIRRTNVLLQNANRSLARLPGLIEDAQRTSARADELLVAFSQITKSVHSGVSSLEGLATRSSTLASSLLDEVEPPITRAVALIRAFRSGTQFLTQRWESRVNGRSRTNAGDEHVRER